MKVRSPRPDPNVGRAAVAQTRIAEQAEARAAENDRFFRENFAPRYLEQMDEQLQQGRELQDYTMDLSRRYDQRYWDTTARQQDAFYAAVDAFDTDAERERIAGHAMADVEQATARGMDANRRSMERRGINPSSAAYQAQMNDTQLESSLARAGAATMAREAARREGLNLRGVAAQLGGNLTGAAQGWAGQAAGAGQLGMQGIQAAQGGFNSNNSNWNASMGLASSNWNNVGQLGMDLTRMRYDAARSNAMGFNQILGAGMGLMSGGTTPWIFGSDRRLKTNIERIGTRPDGLGVYAFNYVWGGPRQVGVMADEVRAIYPHAVTRAGGYDMVDYSKLGG